MIYLMKNFFGKINWKRFNLSSWIVVLCTYFFPLQYVNDRAEAGFPIPYLSVHRKLGLSLMNSSAIDLGRLIINIVIVYLVITAGYKVYKQIKEK